MQRRRATEANKGAMSMSNGVSRLSVILTRAVVMGEHSARRMLPP